MRGIALVSLAGAALAATRARAAPRTCGDDCGHTGNASEERFSLDRLVLEPLPWPGRPDRPIDDTNLGKYQVEVRELATHRVVYSRGFASVYGEWETTAEAKAANRTFSESVRFPAPAAPVQVALRKRAADGSFREVWSIVVDPKDRTVDDARPPSPGPVIELLRSG